MLYFYHSFSKKFAKEKIRQHLEKRNELLRQDFTKFDDQFNLIWALCKDKKVDI